MEHNPVGVMVFNPEERQLAIREALKLRLSGMSYADIGDKIGVSPAQAWSYVTKELKRRSEETAEAADEIIALEVQRLDRILEVMWPKVEAGSLDHTETYLRVAQRRAKLLGLDAASKTKVEVVDNRRVASDEEIYQKYRALQERLAKAGFTPHPVTQERNPFVAIKEAELLEDPVKVVAETMHSAPNADETDPKAPKTDEKPSEYDENGPVSSQNMSEANQNEPDPDAASGSEDDNEPDVE